jgi:hypothetical protein
MASSGKMAALESTVFNAFSFQSTSNDASLRASEMSR